MFALEMLLEVGPGKDYMTESHTIEHMRSEFFTPRLANRNKRGTPNADTGALTRARQVVSEVRAAPPESRLDHEIRESILETFPEIQCAVST